MGRPKLCRPSGKVKFRTQAAADQRADTIVRRYRSNKIFDSYQCPLCGHWHLTTKNTVFQSP